MKWDLKILVRQKVVKKYGIKGVGITLSKEQKKKFEERIKENHLEDQLEVRLMDA